MRYTDPLLPLALLFAVGALLNSWRQSKKRPWTLSASILMLLIISSSLLAAFFSRVLEARYDGRAFVDGGEAIVALSGACDPPEPYRPYTALSLDSYDRSVSAVQVYRSQRARPVVVTGSRCAAAMAMLLQSQGVSPELIFQEGRAKNTHENAVYSTAILRSIGVGTVVLVTDAKSMLRAELCFRKEGISVIPYPVGLGKWKFAFSELVPSWEAIRSNSDTLHELLGILWYRWKGWI